MKKLHLISLGCAKNLVDAERLLASIAPLFQLVEEPEVADLIIINTCSFLQSAVEEALENIMSAGQKRKSGCKLVVTGCLPSRYSAGNEAVEMARGLPEVDLFLKPSEYHLFESEIARLMGLPRPSLGEAFSSNGTISGGRLPSTPSFRAYLKISEGCNNHCTYCLIPSLRGPLKSMSMEILLHEARDLAERGVKELTLVAQDLTAYGRDLKLEEALPNLVKKLSLIDGLEWIRLLYAYPERLTEKMVKTLAQTEKVVPYLDLPFQHASLSVLKRMNRHMKRPPAEMVERLRLWWPGLALRSTMIVGFPGETDTEFEELCAFIEQARFDHLGVFKYSREDNTPAALMPDQIAPAVKEKRRRKVMALQRKISLQHNKNRVGKHYDVLVEGVDADTKMVTVGRAVFQAPDVDGLVYFDGQAPPAGQIVSARIIKAADYDLVACLD